MAAKTRVSKKQTPKKDSAKERRRIALAKGAELAKRMQDLETCFDVNLQVALTAALADDYAKLFEEYPDVFPNPPLTAAETRAEAKALREAQDAAEREEAEQKESSRKFQVAMNELTRPRGKPERPN